jgi:hypothetical protein
VTRNQYFVVPSVSCKIAEKNLLDRQLSGLPDRECDIPNASDDTLDSKHLIRIINLQDNPRYYSLDVLRGMMMLRIVL